MKKRFCKEWIKATAVRTVRTMAQTAAAALGTSTLLSEVDWAVVLSTTGLAGIFTVLTALGGLPECNSNGSSESE